MACGATISLNGRFSLPWREGSVSVPRTETGKRLFTDNDPMDMWESDGVTPDDIAAVEDEAVAAERARLVAGVEKLLAEHVEVRGKSMEPDPEHPGLIRQRRSVAGAPR